MQCVYDVRCLVATIVLHQPGVAVQRDAPLQSDASLQRASAAECRRTACH
jgi:hypothetical protein